MNTLSTSDCDIEGVRHHRGGPRKDVDRSAAMRRSLVPVVLGFAMLALAGCSAARHRNAADREVYQIIQQVEQSVFGHTNAFTIETVYSVREPAEVLPEELITDRLQTNRRVLSIEDALGLAVHSSRRYQAEKERLYLTALTLTGERYAFSPQFFAGTTPRFDRSNTGEQLLTVTSDVGLTQLFKTGGRLGVALANDILRFYTGDPRRSIVSIISANLAQPLLRGFGRNNPAVESLTQAERNTAYAVRDFAFFQDAFAVEIVNDYFALLAQKDVIRNRYTNYLSRIAATQRLEARHFDRERLLDVDQARQAELAAKNNYVNFVAGYRNAIDQFKIKLGLPVNEQLYLDDAALAELVQTGLIPVPLDVHAAYRLATERQLLILNEIDRFEDSKRKIVVAADRLKMDLNLIGNASLESERPTDYTNFDPDNIRAGVGLEIDLPLNRLRERNAYRATLIAFESELRNLTLTLDSLKESIERGLRTLEQRRQNYEIQRNAFELANGRVQSAALLLEAGRAETRDLIEAQDAQIAAQNAVTAAIVDYQETRLQLLLDIGALKTEVPRFWLQDHLEAWPLAQVDPAQPPIDAAVLPPDEFFNY